MLSWPHERRHRCALRPFRAARPRAFRAEAGDHRRLPPVSILVPLKGEAAVAGQLLAALARMEYPAPLLDIKLVLEAGSQRVLGVHIVGHGAGEMIQLAAVAVGMGATKADFDRTVAVHPTAAEELVTLPAPQPS